MHEEKGNSPGSQPAANSERNSMAAQPQQKLLRCAYCGTTFRREDTTAMPFCSNRCRQIDLGNWLSESYSLPYEGEGTPDRVEDDPDNLEEN